eukprot:COSAG02_NODE_286_length_25649_cov_13.411272_19_plen_111_part_00
MPICQCLASAGSFFDVFGKSYLAFVFCADVTTEIIGYISQGDDADGPVDHAATTEQVDPRDLRQKEMADIGTLRGDSLHRKHISSAGSSSAWTKSPPLSGQLSKTPPPLP